MDIARAKVHDRLKKKEKKSSVNFSHFFFNCRPTAMSRHIFFMFVMTLVCEVFEFILLVIIPIIKDTLSKQTRLNYFTNKHP